MQLVSLECIWVKVMYSFLWFSKFSCRTWFWFWFGNIPYLLLLVWIHIRTKCKCRCDHVLNDLAHPNMTHMETLTISLLEIVFSLYKDKYFFLFVYASSLNDSLFCFFPANLCMVIGSSIYAVDSFLN